jgi:hypothetical protein
VFPKISVAPFMNKGTISPNTEEMEKNYQGRWNVNMIADYCWFEKRDFCCNTEEDQRTLF